MQCPECKKEIKHLEHEESVFVFYKATLDKNGDIKYSKRPLYSEPETDCEGAFICPECKQELFYNEQDAIKFFKGEK